MKMLDAFYAFLNGAILLQALVKSFHEVSYKDRLDTTKLKLDIYIYINLHLLVLKELKLDNTK